MQALVSCPGRMLSTELVFAEALQTVFNPQPISPALNYSFERVLFETGFLCASSEDQADRELREPPASQVLEIKGMCYHHQERNLFLDVV